MNRKVTILILLFYTSLCARAQYITLPDPTFSKYLVDSFPMVMNSSGQLDTVLAKTLRIKIRAPRHGIKDVWGLQYFHKVVEIKLTSNNLATLPQIDSLKELTILEIDSNQISKLPSLANLTKLFVLNCSSNELDSLPSFVGLKNLVRLFCSNNKLENFPDFAGASRLQHIVANENRLTSLPDGTTLRSLKRLVCIGNKIQVADLRQYVSLEQLDLRGNLLAEFPNLPTNNLLSTFYVSQNFIQTIPDTFDASNLIAFGIDNNYLDFRNLSKVVEAQNFIDFELFPQKTIGSPKQALLKEREGFEIQIEELSYPGNTYHWFKDGKLVATSDTPIFQLPNVTKENSGEYKCVISNSKFKSFQSITSASIRLVVTDCMDLNQLSVIYSAVQCRYPISATLMPSSIGISKGPYVYQLRNIITGAVDEFVDSNLVIKKEGSYDLVIRDVTGCERTASAFIQANRPTSCEPIFYPDLNVPEATYFIDQKGTAKIYDSRGTKVRELNIPAYWEGRDQSGKILDSGLYLIVINEQTSFQVSLMRAN